jgi:hypothetical protein
VIRRKRNVVSKALANDVADLGLSNVRNCGNWQIPFSGGRSECDRTSNILGFHGREVSEDVFGGIAGCEAREDGAECDASPFEDGFAAAHMRVVHDLLFVIFQMRFHEMGTFPKQFYHLQ